MVEFLESLASVRKAAPQGELSWLTQFKESAWDAANKAGLPTTRHEGWRFTSLRPIASLQATTPTPAPWQDLSDELINRLQDRLDPAGLNLVFVDGVFAPDLSGAGSDVNLDNTPLSGIEVDDLSKLFTDNDNQSNQRQSHVRSHVRSHVQSTLEAIENHRKKLPVPLSVVAPQETTLRNLAKAHFGHGIFIQVAENQKISTPIRLVHVFTAACSVDFSHTIVSIEQGAAATLTEVFVNLNERTKMTSESPKALTNAHFRQTVISMAPQSCLTHQRLCSLNDQMIFGTTDAVIPEMAEYHSLAINLPTRLARHELTTMITGSGAKVTLNGLSASQSDNNLDTHSIVDHRVPDTESRQLYKAVLKDRSRSVFSGKIFVRKDAQRTAAFQQSKNLLIGTEAEVDTKPQLEIEADDVRCSHGATVAQINQTELFYLQSRGIPRATAESMLSDAFAGEVWRTGQDPWFESLCSNLLERHFR